MKHSHFLVFLGAAAALSSCNSKQENAASNAPVKLTPVAPPAGGDWTETFAATPEGGFVMGNPAAKVKLIEYGSLTCPHCREFDETGVDPLVNTYVKSGQVSWEFRNYVRDPFDLAATLIARCNGPQSFFAVSRAMYKDQANWVGKVQAVPQAQLEGLQNLPSEQVPPAAAGFAGLPQWAVARGVPEAKSAQCLRDAAQVNKLVEMNANVTQQYPDFPGTPTFIINGKMLKTEGSSPVWDQLKAGLNGALK